MKKKHMICLITLLLFVSYLTAGTYSGGDGTSGNPYQISDLDDLAELSTTSADWGAYFIQTADIDASASSGWGTNGFTCIGNSTTPFSGSYEGQGSVITSLFVNWPDLDNVGMFGYVEDGVIKNLGVTGASITGNEYTGVLAGQTRGSSTVIDHCFTSGSVTGNNFVGGLVGYNLLRATIQNCGSRVAVTGEEYVGGLAGANLETINNCYATGSVIATTGGGGLVDGNPEVNNSFWDTQTSGLASSEGGTGKTSSQLKDIATYTNTATAGLTTAWDFVGTTNNDAGTDDWWNMNLISTKTVNDGYPVPSWWIVTDEPTGDGSSATTPYQIATLNNLYWLSEGNGTDIWDDEKYFEQPSDIAAKSTAYINSGQGFSPIGTSTGTSTIEFNGSYDGQNHAIDYLYINRPDQNYVGLFGYIYEGGNLTNLGISNGNVKGNQYTGMLVGRLSSANTNSIIDITNCYASGSATGDTDVGGLIGDYLYGNLTITNCYVSGSVEGNARVGGMIGRIGDGHPTLENSYSTADITAEGTQGGLIGNINIIDGLVTISSCYSTGNVTISGEYTDYAGGLVGLIVDADENSKIENCYSRGDIIDNANSNSGNIGGLIGQNGESNMSINNCYSTGDVPSGGTGNTGGLIGNLLAGSGTACFWDNTVNSGLTGVGNTSDPTWVNGESTTNMKDPDTFTDAGWDFKGESTNGTDNIWNIGNSRNDGYPYLDWQYPSDPATLPVALSTFTVQFVNNQAQLYWRTQTETDNIGWNIYRAQENDHLLSEKINGSIIDGYGTTTEPHDYTYRDNSLQAEAGTTYYYWIENVDLSGQTTINGPTELIIPDSEEPGHDTPSQEEYDGLYNVKNNPFRPRVEYNSISFNLGQTSKVELSVYNIKGQLVKKLYDGNSMNEELSWDGKDNRGVMQKSGVYFYKLMVNDKIYDKQKVILMK